MPLFAVVIGAVQSEKTLQADTRAVFPPEYTLDNFRVILSGGAQKGAIFEQITYLPDNIKQFYRAFANSTIVALSVTALTLAFGALSAYTVARLRYRMLLVHAAFIGSIGSILVRVRDYLTPNVIGPLGLYVSVLTKPFVAVAFALLVYTVLKAGLISFLGVDLGGPQGPYLAWLLGFLSGFSERFAKDFITGASAKLGEAPLLDPNPPPRRPPDPS